MKASAFPLDGPFPYDEHGHYLWEQFPKVWDSHIEADIRTLDPVGYLLPYDGGDAIYIGFFAYDEERKSAFTRKHKYTLDGHPCDAGPEMRKIRTLWPLVK